MKNAIGVAVNKIEELGIGKRKVNYRMRDAGFSRQRYWGEPFPIIWSEGIAVPMDEKELPLELPFVEKYGPGKNGEGPLSNLVDWVNTSSGKRETSTMPGYAGSSWYFLRYMDPHNNDTFADKKITDYWNQVDVYIGGTEHAVGHLLYSRMWTKFLYDFGLISFEEPFKKLVNQGMITGKSYFFMLNRIHGDKIVSYNSQNTSNAFVRLKYAHQFISNDFKLTKKTLDDQVEKGIVERPSYEIVWEKDGDEEFVFLKEESEKMSKSKFNVDNPNDLVDKYGADTFRMYEMFLGPVEQSKPWDTKGIEGVHRFLKKLWRLFFDDSSFFSRGKMSGGEAIWNEEKPTFAELKTLHKTIKKVEEDTDRFSFNTAVSAFMVCVNELTDLKCHKREILEPLLILLAPYAPHIAEELYHVIGNSDSILNAVFPESENKYLTETEKEYPVSINGKMRTTMIISLEATQQEVEEMVLSNPIVHRWIDSKPIKKIIFVKNKMVNVVV